MMRHFNQSDFQTDCGSPCDPTKAKPVTFWSSSGSQQDIVIQNFKGLVDFSRYSPNINRNAPPALRDGCTDVPTASCVPQLMKDWDRTSSVAPFKDNIAGGASACRPPAPAGKWFSGGNENDQNYEKDCSIPNWTAYSFGGVVGLETNWYKAAPGGNLQPLQEAPDKDFKTNSRSVCSAFNRPELQRLPSPSCTNPELGDWIEVSSGRPWKDDVRGDDRVHRRAPAVRRLPIRAHRPRQRLPGVRTASGRQCVPVGLR
jgi:hypothetical protein